MCLRFLAQTTSGTFEESEREIIGLILNSNGMITGLVLRYRERKALDKSLMYVGIGGNGGGPGGTQYSSEIEHMYDIEHLHETITLYEKPPSVSAALPVALITCTRLYIKLYLSKHHCNKKKTGRRHLFPAKFFAIYITKSFQFRCKKNGSIVVYRFTQLAGTRITAASIQDSHGSIHNRTGSSAALRSPSH